MLRLPIRWLAIFYVIAQRGCGVAEGSGFAASVVVVVVFIHVADRFGHMVVVITYGQLRGMSSPAVAAVVLSRPRKCL